MPYLEQYEMRYGQINGEIVKVNISRTNALSDTPTITELIPATDKPFIVSFDNDKDKFKPIKAKQATITFLSQTGVNATKFSDGADDEWLVTATIEDTGFVLFKGYLVMDDHQQAFLPVGTYNVTLSATDNLGTLKEIPLTDDSGNYIRDYKKKIDVIAQCLRKTNLQLDIIVRDTWMEETQTVFRTGLDFAYLEMKTFEKSNNEAISCYEALEIVFGYHLSIKQYNGQWWIENIDEKNSNEIYAFQFDYTGAYVADLPVVPFNKNIGKTKNIKLINANGLVNYTRPNKFVKLTYEFKFPKEIILNYDFSRGNLTSLPMPPVIIDGVTYYQNKYEIEGWTALEVPTSVIGGTPSASSTNNYIRKLYSDSNKTYEVERYVVIEAHSPAKGFYIESSQFPIQKGDKFDISVDVRWSDDGAFPGSGFFRISPMQVRLRGDNGTNYMLHGGSSADATARWDVAGSGFSSVEYFYVEGNTSEDMTKWRQCTFWNGTSCPPVPTDGVLEILLIHAVEADSADIHFTNLRFDYIPFINGSYSKYEGISNKIEQDGNYKANIDDTISICDSPKKLFKGALFKLVAGKYVLTERWFSGGDLLRQGITPPYPPPDDYLHPFAHLQIYALWNQYNRRFVSISGSAKGLDVHNDVPDLIHNYTFDASVNEVQNKSFMLLGAEHNYKDEKWDNAIFVEVEDSGQPKDYTTPLIFKYEGGKS